MNLDQLESRRVGEYGHFVMPLKQLLEDAASILGSQDPLEFYSEMENISRADQGVHPEEAAILYGLVRAVEPELVLETGTFEGYSTTQIARALNANGFGRLETVDVAADTGSRVPEDLKSVVTFRRKTPSHSMVEILSEMDIGIDLFFHDSLHTYSNTLGELIAFAPFFSPGCVVVCHDAKMDFNKGFGVGRAVREFVQSFGLEYSILDTTCGLAIFRWPDSIESTMLSSILNGLTDQRKKDFAEERFSNRAKRLFSLINFR